MLGQHSGWRCWRGAVPARARRLLAGGGTARREGGMDSWTFRRGGVGHGAPRLWQQQRCEAAGTRTRSVQTGRPGQWGARLGLRGQYSPDARRAWWLQVQCRDAGVGWAESRDCHMLEEAQADVRCHSPRLAQPRLRSGEHGARRAR